MTVPLPDVHFEALLEYLKQNRHFDFTGYKRSSLVRRIQYRMHQVSIADYSTYQTYLDEHPDEFKYLFEVVEINYTHFFRDPQDWDYIVEHIIPKLITDKSPDEPIRVWNAGCSSGEETYTIAILLAEALGLEQFRQRVRIFSTDIDDIALVQARHGTYPQKQVIAEMPNALVDRYFEPVGNSYRIFKALRSSILFHHHNMIQAAPLSKMDLLICRNTLIYFDLDSQTKVLMRFYFSLKEQGFLFLGRSEMIPHHLNIFKPINMHHRVFMKVHKNQLDRRLFTQAFGRSNRTP